MKIVVYHTFYGCDTGCCGHVVETDDDNDMERRFLFSHPYGDDHLKFAQELVHDEYGAEHVADLDWEECVICDD